MSDAPRISPAAQRDLDRIWDRALETWSIDQAERYTRDLWRVMVELAASPYLGQSANRVRSGYRRHPVGTHVIYYRVVGEQVEIIRVLHQKMDVRKAF